MKRVLIVGGGASGLMAAIAAAGQGAKTTLLEKNRQTGRKLLSTGNGRCNFTNRDQGIAHYRTESADFVERALRAFSAEDAVRFFEDLGMTVKDRGGWLYPGSGSAASVAELLRLTAAEVGVKLACDTPVRSVWKENGRFLAETDGWTYEADALILACGTEAAPQTGACGDGWRFAESFGHTVVTPLPALTGLCAAEQDCGKLAGVRADAEATLTIIETSGEGEPRTYRETGEIQFASYGLSGIPVFQLSRYAARALHRGGTCRVRLNLCPQWEEERLLRFLRERKERAGQRKGQTALLGVFPDKLSAVLLERARIPAKKPMGDWTEDELLRLAGQIRGLAFTVTRCRGFEQAQVCTGGVPLGELSDVTMESALVPGLYLTGELLDVDGECGGYNLQWAWTTGYLAGAAAAGKEKRPLC
ncbi:MAG: NAD(P)/FAD-dependent oxidoreductase [Eubacteriales bacterium]|nr:NAD(P)/FAD-dependent oxidoreductase [Eubacteriales bacterium]